LRHLLRKLVPFRSFQKLEVYLHNQSVLAAFMDSQNPSNKSAARRPPWQTGVRTSDVLEDKMIK
jgi:hypothetical protein